MDANLRRHQFVKKCPEEILERFMLSPVNHQFRFQCFSLSRDFGLFLYTRERNREAFQPSCADVALALIP